MKVRKNPKSQKRGNSARPTNHALSKIVISSAVYLQSERAIYRFIRNCILYNVLAISQIRRSHIFTVDGQTMTYFSIRPVLNIIKASMYNGYWCYNTIP